MNEDLRRCLESIRNSMEDIKAMNGSYKLSEMILAQEELGLSDEMVRLIFCLK